MFKSLQLSKSVFQYGKRFFFAQLANLLFFLALGTFSFNCSHFSKDRVVDRTALKLAQKLSLLDPQKGFDGWLDFDINQFPILLFDKHSSRTYHIQNGRVIEVSNHELPKEFLNGSLTFDVAPFRDHEALVLFYNSETVDRNNLLELNLLYFTVHEGFHLFYQKNNKVFQQQPTHQSRGEFYPILEQPRYFRYEMFRALNRYLKTSDPRSLNAYSWWYFKWYENHREEVSSYTDRIEGSAQYYSNQAMTRIYNSETASKLKPAQHFKKVLMKGGDKYKWFALDKEAYLLGPLTGIILDRLQNKNWKKQVNEKDSPLLLLARMYRPRRQPIDPQLKEEYLLLSVKKMQEVDQNGVLDQTVSQLANPSTIRLVLSHGADTKLSSFSSNGSYRSFFEFKGLDGISITPLSSNMLIQSPGLKIELTDKSALVLSSKNPCSQQNGGTLFLFPPENVQIQDRQVKTLMAPFINHRALKILQRYGITWVCLN